MVHYQFLTKWRIKASPEEIYQILNQPEELPRWWPSVYLDVRTLEAGDTDGKAKVTEMYTKGFLPYSLIWKFTATEKQYPNRMALIAQGDFVGKGVWDFHEDGDYCLIHYDWQLEATKPLLRYLSFLFKPIFKANHHWAMRQGEKSLALEVRRRRATSQEELNKIPQPSGPTFPHNWLNNRIFHKG